MCCPVTVMSGSKRNAILTLLCTRIWTADNKHLLNLECLDWLTLCSFPIEIRIGFRVIMREIIVGSIFACHKNTKHSFFCCLVTDHEESSKTMPNVC